MHCVTFFVDVLHSIAFNCVHLVYQIVFDADTLNTFKSCLDKHWLDQQVFNDFHAELTGTGGASICM